MARFAEVYQAHSSFYRLALAACPGLIISGRFGLRPQATLFSPVSEQELGGSPDRLTLITSDSPAMRSEKIESSHPREIASYYSTKVNYSPCEDAWILPDAGSSIKVGKLSFKTGVHHGVDNFYCIPTNELLFLCVFLFS